jgi:hypothetical protein
MSWTKKYAMSCLIALFVFTAIDASHRPGKDVRVGAIVVTAAVWPIFLSIVLGWTVGDMFASASREN